MLGVELRRPPISLNGAPSTVVQLDDVKQDEDEGDDARGPLQRVADVAGVGIGIRVGHGAADDQPADDGVKQDRQEDEDPFDQRQHDAQRVNAIDLLLKRHRAVDDRGIGHQVNDHVGPHRNQPAQARTAGRSGTGAARETKDAVRRAVAAGADDGFHEGLS